MEGLPRPTLLIDDDDFQLTNRWQRLPMREGFHWSSFPIIRFYYRRIDNRWVTVATIDVDVFETLGTNSGAGGLPLLGGWVGS